jgi:hypothetical protein
MAYHWLVHADTERQQVSPETSVNVAKSHDVTFWMSLHVIVNGLKDLKTQNISDISGIIKKAGVGGCNNDV